MFFFGLGIFVFFIYIDKGFDFRGLFEGGEVIIGNYICFIGSKVIGEIRRRFWGYYKRYVVLEVKIKFSFFGVWLRTKGEVVGGCYLNFFFIFIE